MATRLTTVIALLAVVLGMRAQTVVEGMVTDRQTGGPLSHVSVVAEGGTAHTVTNEEGRFVLKTAERPRYLLLRHIGYKTVRQPVVAGAAGPLSVAMAGSLVALDEVVVYADDARSVVRAAMNRIRKNYPKEPELLRCFYRETARRGSRFIAVAEAVLDMYKTDYGTGPDFDAVAIAKGRRLMSMKASDTLGVKMQGGPVMPLMVDVAKNPDYLLNMEGLNHCELHMEMPTKINDRLHYVVRIEPLKTAPFPLMGGLLYIDQATLAFSRAELFLDMADRQKAVDYMLVRKPAGLRFRPKELTMTVVYSTDGQGVTRLSYVRNEMRFACDWKRRLFSSSFSMVSEMVVTERQQHGRGISRPRGRSTFGIRERFYDRVEYFDDPLFWAEYNIIEPTESLDHAIDKLKKRVR